MAADRTTGEATTQVSRPIFTGSDRSRTIRGREAATNGGNETAARAGSFRPRPGGKREKGRRAGRPGTDRLLPHVAATVGKHRPAARRVRQCGARPGRAVGDRARLFLRPRRRSRASGRLDRKVIRAVRRHRAANGGDAGARQRQASARGCGVAGGDGPGAVCGPRGGGSLGDAVVRWRGAIGAAAGAGPDAQPVAGAAFFRYPGGGFERLPQSARVRGSARHVSLDARCRRVRHAAGGRAGGHPVAPLPRHGSH